jgi:hypothetical protein
MTPIPKMHEYEPFVYEHGAYSERPIPEHLLEKEVEN